MFDQVTEKHIADKILLIITEKILNWHAEKKT